MSLAMKHTFLTRVMHESKSMPITRAAERMHVLIGALHVASEYMLPLLVVAGMYKMLASHKRAKLMRVSAT